MLIAAPLRATGAILDWDNLTWTTGSLSNTYYATNLANPTGYFYKDDEYSGVASVTIWITGDTRRFSDDSPSLQSNDPSGGLLPQEMNRRFRLDFNQNIQISSPSTSSLITLSACPT